jgi:hypothetical protein
VKEIEREGDRGPAVFARVCTLIRPGFNKSVKFSDLPAAVRLFEGQNSRGIVASNCSGTDWRMQCEHIWTFDFECQP